MIIQYFLFFFQVINYVHGIRLGLTKCNPSLYFYNELEQLEVIQVQLLF